MRSSERRVGRFHTIAALVAAVVALDLGTKHWAERQLETPVDLIAGAQLALSHNSGVAFGRLADAPGAVVLAVVGVAFVAFTLAVARGWLPASPIAIALLAGGATANLLDRIGDGRVTDFIDPSAWPAFNLADVAISVGVLLLLLQAFRPGGVGADGASCTTDAAGSK